MFPRGVFKIKCPKKQPHETGGSFWTALAERSGDSAFRWTIRTAGRIQSGVALRLPPQSITANRGRATPSIQRFTLFRESIRQQVTEKIFDVVRKWNKSFLTTSKIFS